MLQIHEKMQTASSISIKFRTKLWHGTACFREVINHNTSDILEIYKFKSHIYLSRTTNIILTKFSRLYNMKTRNRLLQLPIIPIIRYISVTCYKNTFKNNEKLIRESYTECMKMQSLLHGKYKFVFTAKRWTMWRSNLRSKTQFNSIYLHSVNPDTGRHPRIWNKSNTI
jgi:hypothetical protein